MENIICTVVKEKTPEEFISVLNKYGICIDYSNDYERSKSLQGIFVGVINKVYDVVWKGEGGHLEHDSLFMSAKSLLYCKRESEPFRIGFVGKIVSQLVEINLKEGDAIGILKPKFFYALDIPTLCAGVGNVVVWVGKDLKVHGMIEDASQSSDENQYFQSLTKTNNHTDNKRKRIIEDSDTHSVGKSSTSGTLRHDVQIFRSRPAVLKSPEASANNRSAPDSTTRTLVRKRQNNICDENENPSENVLTENIVSQNTANVGSAADNSCINEIELKNLVCNLNSAVKSVRYDSCRSFHKVPNNTCGSHSHITCHQVNCCGSRVSCCNHHIITANHCKEIPCYQNYRSSCACFSNHHCSRIRNCCCAHNAEAQCMHWNSAHSCHTDNSSCNRHFEHECRPMKSCCAPCDSPIIQCCNSHCQSGCIKSKCFHRPTNLDKTSTSCCYKQISAPIHNSCCCNHERVNAFENTRASHCCDSRNKANSKNPKLGNANEEEGTEFSEESNINSRTKEWVSNWVENPPHLLPDGIEASKHSGTSSQNPLLESRHSVVETGATCSKQRQDHSITSSPTNCISNTVVPKHVAKKIKLFSPLENSTIISEKSMYRNATIVEESTPFDSENYTDTPRDHGLSAGRSQEPKDKNVTKNINLPLSNNIGLDDTLDATLKDPPAAKEVNNTVECSEERLCPETNAKESPITNQLQNKDTLSGENKNLSEEPFPELWIETPIISQTCTEPHIDQNRIEISNKNNQGESCIGDHDEVSCLKDNICSNEQSKETTTVEKINPHIEKIDESSNKESSIKKVSDVHEVECDGKNDSGSNESNLVPAAKNKDSSSIKSLALQDHSKSDKEVVSRMDSTLVNDTNKEGMKRSKESSDDAMELTCESLLMKRRKKEKFRKARSVGSLCSGRNNHETSIASSDTFYDARSDGILSLRSNKWCLKPIKEVFDKPLSRKVIEGLSLLNNSPYSLNLFSTFNVVGAIINIFPSLSQENFGNLVEGFCNEGCRKKYSYEDYKEVESVCAHCTFCRYNYHLACPGCSQSGLERPLCLYFNFEIHLFDGENVLRIEIDHKSGVDFLGCTPQHYLNSGTIYKKINKIIFPILQDQWVNPILLKANVKVNCKSGATVLTLDGTSLKKHLILKGKHYKL